MGAVIVALVGALMVLNSGERLGNERVVVLPSADGHVGTVIVERGDVRVVLNEAYATSIIRDGGEPVRETLSPAEARADFSVVLGALRELADSGERLGNERVVVLPSSDGHVGTVIVERSGVRVVLNEAYATSIIRDGGEPVRETLSPEEARADFSVVLGALPELPKAFLVYFNEGTDELTPESRVEFEKIRAELRERSAPDIAVIGHTDRRATDVYNDRLSLQRAERVREELIKLGIPPARIQASGRGEREPLVPTPDGVSEPQNRRVEINVR